MLKNPQQQQETTTNNPLLNKPRAWKQSHLPYA